MASSSTSKNKIVLTSSDGESFEVEEAVAHMIEDDCADKAIPLANVTGNVLSKVVEYCKKHVEEGGALVEDDDEAKKKLQNWETEFMKQLDLDMVFELVLAAHYLNMKGLLNLTCQTVADHIQDKQPEEVRKIFNIKNEFTPEEEAAIRKENESAYKIDIYTHMNN